VHKNNRLKEVNHFTSFRAGIVNGWKLTPRITPGPRLRGERLQTLTIHHGRHAFISHALAGGRSLAEVRDAAGHAHVSITSAYLHVAVEDDAVGNLFCF